ncbi:hypothetical protein DAEQUDRAFT_608509 [Daedalea quercina L-15889]|uniref:Uncharacterized protein n=1 Tax=Daedalea quercina L-15889 TaxID=1314783 RepID=A0A165LIA7_9APHY|nr:hypothetical protein DAEQUDRAFT_608509 [Daedalea quercina L-15889]
MRGLSVQSEARGRGLKYRLRACDAHVGYTAKRPNERRMIHAFQSGCNSVSVAFGDSLLEFTGEMEHTAGNAIPGMWPRGPIPSHPRGESVWRNGRRKGPSRLVRACRRLLFVVDYV